MKIHPIETVDKRRKRGLPEKAKSKANPQLKVSTNSQPQNLYHLVNDKKKQKKPKNEDEDSDATEKAEDSPNKKTTLSSLKKVS